MNASRWISSGFLMVALGASGAWLAQRQSTAALRTQLTGTLQQNRELAGVRAENERLQRERVSPWELQRLRSDHAALSWLQIEVDALRASVAARQRAAEAHTLAANAGAVISPALVVNLGIAADGAVLMDGRPSELAVLEQRLAALARDSRVEIRLAVNPAQRDAVQETTRRMLAVAKEHGLQMEVKYDRGGP